MLSRMKGEQPDLLIIPGDYDLLDVVRVLEMAGNTDERVGASERYDDDRELRGFRATQISLSVAKLISTGKEWSHLLDMRRDVRVGDDQFAAVLILLRFSDMIGECWEVVRPVGGRPVRRAVGAGEVSGPARDESSSPRRRRSRV